MMIIDFVYFEIFKFKKNRFKRKRSGYSHKNTFIIIFIIKYVFVILFIPIPTNSMSTQSSVLQVYDGILILCIRLPIVKFPERLRQTRPYSTNACLSIDWLQVTTTAACRRRGGCFDNCRYHVLKNRIN